MNGHERTPNAVVVALTLVALLSACSGVNPAPSASAVAQGTYQRMTDPSVCTSPTGDPNYLPPTVIECGKFESLSPAEQQIILQAERSTPAQFFQLPLANQEAFQNFVLDNTSEKTLFVVEEVLNNLGLGTYSIKRYYPHYDPKKEHALPDSDQVATGLAALEHLYQGEQGNRSYDVDTARKLLPAVAAVGSAAYAALLRGIDAADTTGLFGRQGKVGMNSVGPYMFMPFYNIEDGDTKKLRDGRTAQQETAQTTQFMKTSDVSGWPLPYGEVTVSYSYVNSATIDGSGTTNVLLEDVKAHKG